MWQKGWLNLSSFQLKHAKKAQEVAQTAAKKEEDLTGEKLQAIQKPQSTLESKSEGAVAAGTKARTKQKPKQWNLGKFYKHQCAVSVGYLLWSLCIKVPLGVIHTHINPWGRLEVIICKSPGWQPTFMCGLMSNLVICKFRKSMVIHDTGCPYRDQVSLNNTTQNKPNQTFA